MALRVSLPDEINPADDWCIPVYIPASAGYLMALRSVLTLLGHWYAWERDEDRRGKDAAYRWLMADLKTAAALQAGQRCGNCNAPGDTVDIDALLECIGEGVSWEDEDMGQVLVKIAIEDGKLYQYFSPCCKELVGDIQRIEADNPDIGVPGDEDVIGTLPAGLTFSACAKAKALHTVWVDAIDKILDGVTNVKFPNVVKNEIESAWGVKLGGTDFTSAWLAGVNIVAQGYASETEDAEAMQELLCRIETRMTADENGITSSVFDAVKSDTQSVAVKYFNVTTYPSAFGSMQTLWVQGMAMIGDGDARDLTTMVVATGAENCDCPDASIPDTEWFYDFDFTTSDQNWRLNVGHEWESGVGFKGEQGYFSGTQIGIWSPDNWTGPVQGAVTFVRVHYDLTSLGNDTLNDPAHAVDYSDLVSEEAGFLTMQAVRAFRYFDKSVWQGHVAYNQTLGTEKIWFRFSHRERENGNVQMIVSRIEIGGVGEPPMPAPIA